MVVVLNSFPHGGLIWQLVYKEYSRRTRLMQRSVQVKYDKEVRALYVIATTLICQTQRAASANL